MEDRSVFKILEGKPTGKRPLRRPRHRWKDNIRKNPKETCINTGIGLIGLMKRIFG